MVVIKPCQLKTLKSAKKISKVDLECLVKEHRCQVRGERGHRDGGSALPQQIIPLEAGGRTKQDF